jgi:DNA-binding MarR family transcriptional regulator
MADADWLDDGEQRAWRGFLRMHARVTSRLRRQMHRDTGLSYADYEVLVHLSEAPDGRLRAFQLGDVLQWEKSRVSHQLSRMAARGLVVREGCPTDRRGAFIVITAIGRKAIEAAAPLHVAEVRRAFLDALAPDQLDALADIADAVVGRLDEG